MIVSTVSVSFSVFAEESGGSSFIKIPDPGVTVSCTDITWVASGFGSYTAGNSIVPATPSGIPLVGEDYDSREYAGETPAYTTITAVFTNLPEETPQISCTDGGQGVIMSTATVSKKTKTYTWTVTSGRAQEGESLEFSITYVFNGRTYTNKAYSYVRALAQPAGVLMESACRIKHNYFDNYNTASSSILARIMGKDVYSSLATFTTTSNAYRGYYNAHSNSFVRADSTDYNILYQSFIKNETTTYKDFHHYSGGKSMADVYVDTSVVKSLADLNLRAVVNKVNYYGENYYDTVPTFCFDVGSVAPSQGFGSGTGNAFLGASSISKSYFTLGEQDTVYLTGTDFSFSDEYTLCVKSRGESGNISTTCYAVVGLRFHYVDKSQLRSLVSNILAGTLYEEDSPLSVFGRDKGPNPQSWYYMSGWTQYSSAMREAMRVVNKPNATRVEIEDASIALKSAYDNLVMKAADYKALNAIVDLSEEALRKEDWFVPAKAEALRNELDKVRTGLNSLFQAQVDKWTEDVTAAYNGLSVLPADYTTVDEAVAQAEYHAGLKAYDGYSIYADFSQVSAAVAAVRYDLTREDQALITKYAADITAAIAALEIRTADYSAVDSAVQTAKSLNNTNYTNFQAVRSAVNAVRYNKKITEQETVNGYAARINEAIAALIEKPASFTELEADIAAANALVEEYYTPVTYRAVQTALANCYSCNKGAGYTAYTITKQNEVEKLRVALETALGNLVMYDADYSRVTEAIGRWEAIPESEKAQFSEISIQNITTAIGAVVYGKKINEQALVNEYADEIFRAIGNIDYIPADYTAVNNALTKVNILDRTYWADMSGVDNAVNAVNWSLGINRQSEVDEMATAILEAINQLVPGPANYSRLNAAIERFNNINKSYYTLESVQNVEEVINNVNWNLTKENQADVYLYAMDVNDAILDLVEADADYKELNKTVNSIPGNLSSLYTQETVAPLQKIVSSINWSLKAKDQATVDGYIVSINNALRGLTYLPGDYSQVDAEIAEGRRRIKNGVLQPDGDIYPISAESAAEFEAFVASLNRSYNIVQTEQIALVAKSVKDKYGALKYDESIYDAMIKLNADKTVTFPEDTVTVSVVLKTEFYTASSSIPVLYDSNCFTLLGANINEAYTFSGTYADGSLKGGSVSSPAKGYPSSYTAADRAQWKYAFITLAPSSQINPNAVIIDPEQTVVTFTLKVNDDVDVQSGKQTGRIWIDPAFLKTEDNLGGKLFIGRFDNSVVDINVESYGQTINLDNADISVDIFDPNAPAETEALANAVQNVPAYGEDYYTEETYSAYTTALGAAQDILENSDSYTIRDQATVDAATETLVNAFNALKLKDADTKPLEDALLLTPEYDESYYTAESYSNFTSTIEVGRNILKEEGLTVLDNERIIQAAQDISDALDLLQLKPFSYLEELNNVINSDYLYFDERLYDPDACEAYYSAFDNADMFFWAADAGDKDIRDDAEGREIIDALYSARITAEKTAISSIIASSTPEHDLSVYTEASVQALQNAIDTAGGFLADDTLTYAQIDELCQAGQDVLDAFASLEIKPFSYEGEIWAAYDMFLPRDEGDYEEDTVFAYYDAYDRLDMFIWQKYDSWTALDDAEARDILDGFYDAWNNLKLRGADIEALTEALALPAEDEKYYTAESYAPYKNAVEAGQALLTADFEHQDEVDNAAAAIAEAYGNLSLLPFTKLPDLQAALINVPSKQETEYYASYWNAYKTAKDKIEQMISEADTYSVVQDEEAVNAIEEYNTALNDLEIEGPITFADYSQVNAAVQSATEKLQQMQSTGHELVQSTVEALQQAIESIVYNLDSTHQSEVDGYALAVNNASDGLKYVPKFVITNEEIEISDGMLFGMTDIASEEQILDEVSCVGDCTVVIEKTENGYGTGTVIRLTDNDGQTIESLMIVVYGDTDGSGYCDAFDVAVTSEMINNFEEPESKAIKAAMDVYADGWLDAIDLSFVIGIANGEAVI